MLLKNIGYKEYIFDMDKQKKHEKNCSEKNLEQLKQQGFAGKAK